MINITYWIGVSFRLFIFDSQGHFLNTIGKRGQGPGEYREVYDVIIDENKKEVGLLSPFGSIYYYNLDGSFIKETKLTNKINYQEMARIGNNIITWSVPMDSKDACISVLDAETGEEKNTFLKGPRILNSNYGGHLYQYDHKTYCAPTFFQNKVYEITADSLRIAYQWDFGKDNIDLSKFDFSFTDEKEEEEGKTLNKLIKDDAITNLPTYQIQNRKFYFVRLLAESGNWKSVFYRKSDQHTFCFDRSKEGIRLMIPSDMTEDYMVCIVPYDEFESYKSVLSAEEYQKLSSRLEDDNPCLIKFYFK